MRFYNGQRAKCADCGRLFWANGELICLACRGYVMPENVVKPGLRWRYKIVVDPHPLSLEGRKREGKIVLYGLNTILSGYDNGGFLAGSIFEAKGHRFILGDKGLTYAGRSARSQDRSD